MGKNTKIINRPTSQIKKLHFLIGNWHTSGEILQGAPKTSSQIRGMDCYEWISGGHFILHRADVFMGKERIEVIEIIGYDKDLKCYFMRSFDNHGSSTTMYASLEKSGVLKLGHNRMRSTLTIDKSGDSMHAKWEISENGKIWKPWLKMQFTK